MAVRSKLRSGDRVPSGSPAQIPCLLGTCPLGTVGQTYTLDPGDDVVGTLGGGKLAQAVLYIHATTGSRVVVVPTAGTYSALPSVTATGSGPSVSAALTAGNPVGGAYDDLSILAKVKVPGVGGVAQVDLYYDGYTVAETRTVPAEVPASLTGTVPITAEILAKISGTTLVFAGPSVATLTFATGSMASSAAGLKAATATVASTVTVLPGGLLSAGIAALLANPRKLRFTTAGGTPADAPANVVITGTDYTGAAQSETLALAQTASSATSTKVYASITSLAYPAADGTAATIAVGYEDAFASAAEVAAAVSSLASGASLAVVGLDVQTSTARYLGLATTAAGVSAALSLNASPGTAATLLGFSGSASASGAAATSALPFTGVTLTWPTGTYPLAGTYALPLSGPHSSVSALVTAATATHDTYAQAPFVFLVPVEEFATQATAAAALSALNSLTATWLADPSAPIYVHVIVPTAFHTASATKTTNDANIATNDAAFQAAFPPSTPDSVLNNVAHDDIYIPGAAGLPAGTFRRPASWAAASKVAGAAKIAANAADGGVSGATLLAPDGLTRARNENTATTKLGGLGGAGCWALKSTSQGLAAPAFEICASRAGATSRLRDPGAMAIGLEILRITFGEVEVWNGQTWEGDASNPAAANISETEPRAHHLDQLLGQTLRPADYATGADAQDGAAPPNVTAFDVKVNAPTLGNDGKVLVDITYNPLGVVGDVRVTVTGTGAAITSAG